VGWRRRVPHVSIPEFFTRLNVWIGFKRFGSPKYVTFIRRLGVIEMILAALAAVSDLVLPALGVKW
jgi:hypothetical protein